MASTAAREVGAGAGASPSGASPYGIWMSRVLGLAAASTLWVLLGCGSAAVPPRQSGKALFDADCSKCHSLIGNESLRRPGGDLLGYRINDRQLAQFVREMPIRRPLNPTQSAAIVKYVSAYERSPRKR